mgnify:FL=1
MAAIGHRGDFWGCCCQAVRQGQQVVGMFVCALRLRYSRVWRVSQMNEQISGASVRFDSGMGEVLHDIRAILQELEDAELDSFVFFGSWGVSPSFLSHLHAQLLVDSLKPSQRQALAATM